MGTPQQDPNKGWVRLGQPVTPKEMVFGGSPADNAPPHTEMTVQLTLSAQAHPDDVAAVIERLQAAIQDAAGATGGRIDIHFALPEIIR